MERSRLNLLENRISQLENEILEISQQEVIVENDFVDMFSEPHGELWEKLKEKGDLAKFTNFTEVELLSLYRKLVPFIQNHRRRGPLPKISFSDSLLILLTFYKTALEFDELAVFLGYKSSTLMAAINRMRPILYDCLQDEWLAHPQRPQPLDDTHFPFIGLLVDSTSIEVFRPRTHFNEAKVYYDGKNRIYALKKELGVLVSNPHYCVFTQKSFVGSRHDYEYFKENYRTYLPYLVKTTEEFRTLKDDQEHQSWAVLLDKGYIGPECETHDLRKLTPLKNPTRNADIMKNREKSLIRVPVECFFGRLKKLWKILRGIYRWSHENFDIDFDICCLLTNLHIKSNRLEEIDRTFLLQLFQQKNLVLEEKEKKRKKTVTEYKRRKKRKLTDLQTK